MHVQAKSSTNEHIILVHGLLDSAYNGLMQSADWTHGLADSRTHTGNEICFDPSRHRTYK